MPYKDKEKDLALPYKDTAKRLAYARAALPSRA
jgi:hypothetical protein